MQEWPKRSTAARLTFRWELSIQSNLVNFWKSELWPTMWMRTFYKIQTRKKPISQKTYFGIFVVNIYNFKSYLFLNLRGSFEWTDLIFYRDLRGRTNEGTHKVACKFIKNAKTIHFLNLGRIAPKYFNASLLLLLKDTNWTNSHIHEIH